jgi:hypothetical protein
MTGSNGKGFASHATSNQEEHMKTIRTFFLGVVLTVLLAGCAGVKTVKKDFVQPPPGTLDAASVTALFSGKTVESVLDKTGRVSLTYYGPTGELRQLQNGEKRSGKWEVREDGRICLHFAGDDRQCRAIVKEGGVYRKYIVKKDGNHEPVVTYRSFRDGNLVDN